MDYKQFNLEMHKSEQELIEEHMESAQSFVKDVYGIKADILRRFSALLNNGSCDFLSDQLDILIKVAQSSPKVQEEEIIDRERKAFAEGIGIGIDVQKSIVNKDEFVWGEERWISVKDELPNIPQFVIAYKNNGLILGLYFSADKEFRYGQDCDQTSQVTHWMPLPNAPKKDEN